MRKIGAGTIPSALLLAMILAAFCFLRWHDLTADLPSYFDVGISATDEGTYMDGPRKWVQTGSWNLPGEWWHSQKLVPLYSFMLAKWFEVLGVGFWEGRAMSALLGCLTLVLVTHFGWKRAGPVGAMKLLTIVGSSYVLTHFHRAAMVESLMLFWLWGIVLAVSCDRAWWREPVMGLCAAGLVLTKLSGVLALPGLFLWWLLRDRGWQSPSRLLTAVLFFAFPIAMVATFHPGFLGRSWAYAHENFGSLLNLPGAPWHLLHMGVRGMWLSRESTVVALMALGVLVWPTRQDRRQWDPHIWGLVGALVACSLHDFAVRRYLMMLPFIHMLAWRATLVDVGAPIPSDLVSPPLGGRAGWGASVVQATLLFLAFSGIPLAIGHFGWIPIKYIVGGGALLAMAGLWVMPRWVLVAQRVLPRVKGWLLAGALGLLILQHGGWRLASTHHTYDLIRDCAGHFNKAGPPVYGVVAPLLTIESHRQAVFIDGRMGDPLRGNPAPLILEVITYTRPSFGYENLVIDRLAGYYTQHDLIMDGPMFSEGGVERAIGVFRFCRPKPE
ncbi:MAG: ArnT family glycosyltransferase [Planctomycetota bacterium]